MNLVSKSFFLTACVAILGVPGCKTQDSPSGNQASQDGGTANTGELEGLNLTLSQVPDVYAHLADISPAMAVKYGVLNAPVVPPMPPPPDNTQVGQMIENDDHTFTIYKPFRRVPWVASYSHYDGVGSQTTDYTNFKVYAEPNAVNAMTIQDYGVGIRLSNDASGFANSKAFQNKLCDDYMEMPSFASGIFSNIDPAVDPTGMTTFRSKIDQGYSGDNFQDDQTWIWSMLPHSKAGGVSYATSLTLAQNSTPILKAGLTGDYILNSLNATKKLVHSVVCKRMVPNFTVPSWRYSTHYESNHVLSDGQTYRITKPMFGWVDARLAHIRTPTGISQPDHAGSDLNGVCRLFGYQMAVGSSALTVGSYSQAANQGEKLVTIDGAGKMAYYNNFYTGTTSAVNSIDCKYPIEQVQNLDVTLNDDASVTIHNPLASNIYTGPTTYQFAAVTDPYVACQFLGYAGGVAKIIGHRTHPIVDLYKFPGHDELHAKTDIHPANLPESAITDLVCSPKNPVPKPKNVNFNQYLSHPSPTSPGAFIIVDPLFSDIIKGKPGFRITSSGNLREDAAPSYHQLELDGICKLYGYKTAILRNTIIADATFELPAGLDQSNPPHLTSEDGLTLTYLPSLGTDLVLNPSTSPYKAAIDFNGNLSRIDFFYQTLDLFRKYVKQIECTSQAETTETDGTTIIPAETDRIPTNPPVSR